MKIAVTIPAYNEEKTIGSVIKKIKEVMSKNNYNYEIVVVDDGSTDNTVNIAKSLGAKVFSHPKNYGISEAFKTEMKKCLELNADIIVHFDADGQYVAEQIPFLIKELKNADLVLGSRFRGKIESMPLIKRLGNKAFSKVISQITGLKITDGQTGFRAFTREVAENIKISSKHTYTQEQIIRAVSEKYRIKEIPITFLKRKSGKSRLISNPFEYAFKAWVNIFRIYRDYWPLRFFGITGGSFFGIGFIMGLWLVSIYIRTGVVGHIPTAILSVLLMLIGMQIILFGFLADMVKND